MKRIVTIQDISCIGKCSLTVALPILSAMGIETVILPTAILSNHTAFPSFSHKDLSDEMDTIVAEWKKLDIHFDAIYIGYLGSYTQIDWVLSFLTHFQEKDTLVMVDPVMGDHGKLYATFDLTYAAKMTELCRHADIIVPNITEAALMTGMEYKEIHNSAYIREMLQKLSLLGPNISVVTGVSPNAERTGITGWERRTGTLYQYSTSYKKGIFHGTGDVFASTCIGAMLRGYSWQEATKLAADFTSRCIDATLSDPSGRWYGVNFEEALPYLIEQLQA